MTPALGLGSGPGGRGRKSLPHNTLQRPAPWAAAGGPDLYIQIDSSPPLRPTYLAGFFDLPAALFIDNEMIAPRPLGKATDGGGLLPGPLDGNLYNREARSGLREVASTPAT